MEYSPGLLVDLTTRLNNTHSQIFAFLYTSQFEHVLFSEIINEKNVLFH